REDPRVGRPAGDHQQYRPGPPDLVVQGRSRNLERVDRRRFSHFVSYFRLMRRTRRQVDLNSTRIRALVAPAHHLVEQGGLRSTSRWNLFPPETPRGCGISSLVMAGATGTAPSR